MRWHKAVSYGYWIHDLNFNFGEIKSQIDTSWYYDSVNFVEDWSYVASSYWHDSVHTIEKQTYNQKLVNVEVFINRNQKKGSIITVRLHLYASLSCLSYIIRVF